MCREGEGTRRSTKETPKKRGAPLPPSTWPWPGEPRKPREDKGHVMSGHAESPRPPAQGRVERGGWALTQGQMGGRKWVRQGSWSEGALSVWGTFCSESQHESLCSVPKAHPSEMVAEVNCRQFLSRWLHWPQITV